MYKALAQVDTVVRLPSGKIGVVTRHLAGNFVEVEYVDGSGTVDIDAHLLRPGPEVR